MENAVQALKTAAAVLIFAIAITVSFTMFSKAKVTADTVLKSQDDQEYLEAAELDDKLYTSSELISTTETGESSSDARESKVAGITTKGDRIVGSADVISTIYRYNLEKYGVTILESDGTVISRFDSNTENVMRQWYNIADGTDAEGNTVSANTIRGNFAEQIKRNISNNYIKYENLKLDLENLYEIEVDGNSKIECGAPWYGNDKEIIKRINAEIGGFEYELNNQKYNYNESKNLSEALENKKIVEVVNEIDNSKYLQDGENSTSLLQQYELPTIEVIYIVYLK